MLSLAICDDDLEFAQNLGKIIRREFTQEVMIQTYRSGLQLWHDFSNGLEAFDVLLMDINMPALDGIEASIRIRQKDTLVPIIFLTNHQDEMPRSFQAQPYDFLTKPFEEKNLIAALEKAMSFAQLHRPRYSLLIKTRQRSYHLSIGEIVYIESVGRKLHIHTDTDTHMINGKISDMAKLLEGNGFVHAHRSVLVNLYAVRYIDYTGRTIHMRDGKTVVMSRERIANIKLSQHQMFRLKIHV